MPELPEVETIVHGLKKELLNKQIVEVWHDWPRVFQFSEGGCKEFKKHVLGLTILKIERLGKYIVISLGKRFPQSRLLIHLKMTGRILIGTWKVEGGRWKSLAAMSSQDNSLRYVHSALIFADGTAMLFSDIRKFGRMILVEEANFERHERIRTLGVDPLQPVDVDSIAQQLQNRSIAIKQVLLDQSVVSGIGNIYGDEILFKAGIHPLTKASDLTFKDITEILKAAKRVLQKAIRLGGSSMRDYRDAEGKKGTYFEHRLVYKREGLACIRCKNSTVERVIIHGRSSHYCPNCQKRGV